MQQMHDSMTRALTPLQIIALFAPWTQKMLHSNLTSWSTTTIAADRLCTRARKETNVEGRQKDCVGTFEARSLTSASFAVHLLAPHALGTYSSSSMSSANISPCSDAESLDSAQPHVNRKVSVSNAMVTAS